MQFQKVSSRSLVKFYGPELARKRWQLYGSVRFRRADIPLWMAERRFEDWIFALEGDVEEDDCQWFLVCQHGAFPQKPIFHVLLRSLRFETKYLVMLACDGLGGDADLEYCSFHWNPISFMREIAQLGSEFDLSYKLD
jgi:hypothetical protein